MKNLFKIIFLIFVIILFQMLYIQHRLNERIGVIYAEQVILSHKIDNINVRAGQISLKVKKVVLRCNKSNGFRKPILVVVDNSFTVNPIEAGQH